MDCGGPACFLDFAVDCGGPACFLDFAVDCGGPVCFLDFAVDCGGPVCFLDFAVDCGGPLTSSNMEFRDRNLWSNFCTLPFLHSRLICTSFLLFLIFLCVFISIISLICPVFCFCCLFYIFHRVLLKFIVIYIFPSRSQWPRVGQLPRACRDCWSESCRGRGCLL